MQIILEHLFNQTKTYPLENMISPSLVAKGEGRGEDMCMDSLLNKEEQNTAYPMLLLQQELHHQILPALALHL